MLCFLLSLPLRSLRSPLLVHQLHQLCPRGQRNSSCASLSCFRNDAPVPRVLTVFLVAGRGPWDRVVRRAPDTGLIIAQDSPLSLSYFFSFFFFYVTWHIRTWSYTQSYEVKIANRNGIPLNRFKACIYDKRLNMQPNPSIDVKLYVTDVRDTLSFAPYYVTVEVIHSRMRPLNRHTRTYTYIFVRQKKQPRKSLATKYKERVPRRHICCSAHDRVAEFYSTNEPAFP